jgi:hypothetical protein
MYAMCEDRLFPEEAVIPQPLHDAAGVSSSGVTDIAAVFRDVHVHPPIETSGSIRESLQRLITECERSMRPDHAVDTFAVPVLTDESLVFVQPFVSLLLPAAIRCFVTEHGTNTDPLERLLDEIE